MATNAPNNVFYPGYYPGAPIPRSPRGKYTPPPEYAPNVFDSYIDEFDADITGFPGWLKDQLVGDVKKQFKATAVPKGSKKAYTAQDIRDDPDSDELAGAAGLTFNLNPLDWINDPAKTAKESISSFLDPADFSLRNERDRIWKPLVYGNEASPQLQKDAYKRILLFGPKIKEAAEGRGLRGTGTGSETPLQLQGLGVFKEDIEERKRIDGGQYFIETKKDVYSDVGASYLDFINAQRASSARPGKYKKVQQTALSALSTEMEQKATSLIQNMPAANQAETETLIKGFIGEANVADKIESLRESVTGPKGLTAALEEDFLRGGADILGRKAEILGTGGSAGKIAEARASIKKVRDLYDGKVGVSADAARRTLFDSHILEFETYLTDLEKVVGGYGASTDRRLFMDNLLQFNKRLSGGSVLSVKGGGPSATGIQERFLNKLLEKDFTDNALLREVLDNDPNFKGTRLRRWLRIGGDIKTREDFSDFLDNVQGGKLLDLYLYVPKLRAKIASYTPAHFVEVFMKKTHYLGSVVDPDYIDDAVGGGVKAFLFGKKGKEFGWAKKLKGANKIDIKFEFSGFSVNFKTSGAKHFNAPIKIFENIEREVPGFFTGAAPFILNASDQAEFIALMNNNLGGFTGKFLALKSYELADFAGGAGHLAGFSSWLKLNAGKLGLELDAVGNIINKKENVERLGLLLRSLRSTEKNPDYLSILRAHVGWLEKASAKINKLQTLLIKKLNKYKLRLINWKNVAAEYIADAIAVAFSGITEGLGAFAAPLLRKFTKYVVYKVLAFMESFVVNLLLKQDIVKFIEGVMESAEKTLKRMLKILAYLSLIPALFFAFVMFIIIMFLSSFSPINPAKGGGFGAAGAYTGPPIAVGGCPVANPRITTRSFNPNDLEGVTHGSNGYWGSCTYSIPYLLNENNHGVCSSPVPTAACAPVGVPQSKCSQLGRTPAQPYYGFALDVASTTPGVFLPELRAIGGGSVTEWSLGSSFSNGSGSGYWGDGVTMIATDGTNNYKMYITHMNPGILGPGTYPVAAVGGTGNTVIGSIYPGLTNPHIHIELLVNGSPVRPEDYLCQ